MTAALVDLIFTDAAELIVVAGIVVGGLMVLRWIGGKL